MAAESACSIRQEKKGLGWSFRFSTSRSNQTPPGVKRARSKSSEIKLSTHFAALDLHICVRVPAPPSSGKVGFPRSFSARLPKLTEFGKCLQSSSRREGENFFISFLLPILFYFQMKIRTLPGVKKVPVCSLFRCERSRRKSLLKPVNPFLFSGLPFWLCYAVGNSNTVMIIKAKAMLGGIVVVLAGIYGDRFRAPTPRPRCRFREVCLETSGTYIAFGD